jgi:tetratricopeptide (TPR) repeat protein
LQGKSTDLPKFEPERDITDFGLEKYELGEPPKDMISQFLGFIPRLSDKLILPALLAAIYPYGLGKKLAELRHRKQTADARLYRLSNIGKHFPLWLLFIWFFMRANSFVDSLNWLQLTIKAHGAESAGALGKAEANYRYAQQVLDSSPTFCEKKVFTTFNLQNFANLLTKEHKYDEAERAFRQAAAISENESEHVRLSSVGKDYAKLLRKWGYADEANKIESSTTTPAELDEMNETLNDD